MRTDDFYYDLPLERIAQTPLEPRDSSRLMVLKRGQNKLEDAIFREIGNYLKPGDLLVINQTRVIPARIFAHKPTGGKVELLLLKRLSANTWEVLVGGKKMKLGSTAIIQDGPTAEVIEELPGSHRVVRFSSPLENVLPSVGEMPLPPYIHEKLKDPNRYQTVYADANQAGSAAAPTAGLHFTPELMQKLESQGIQFARVTLHVGLDTFAPVTEGDPSEHQIHSEWCEVTQETADLINLTHTQGGRVIGVGTTSVRTLESAAAASQIPHHVTAISGPTRLFILPGFQFQIVDAMVTNFHLPESTLIMLVSAFAGRETILNAYNEAVKRQYRFYSFGDAMFIV
ncbi:MAG: tRNA preQ1(34) S-adenosylmethionine ribosyltransferase-isomerase QueA [Anaerolineaceae bacterium]